MKKTSLNCQYADALKATIAKWFPGTLGNPTGTSHLKDGFAVDLTCFLSHFMHVDKITVTPPFLVFTAFLHLVNFLQLNGYQCSWEEF